MQVVYKVEGFAAGPLSGSECQFDMLGSGSACLLGTLNLSWQVSVAKPLIMKLTRVS